MTEPLTLAVALLALVTALLLAATLVPRAVPLDEDRWFKTALATLLRGRVEAAGGDVAAWEAAVASVVWYHPAGRLPERKVRLPGLSAIPGAALPGEQALVERLARLPDEPARWRALYALDPEGDARLDDPVGLGDEQDPAALLGPGWGWEGVAGWGAGGETPDRAAALDATWVLVPGRPGPPDVLGALAALLGERAFSFAWEDDPQAAAEALVEALRPRFGPPGHLLVLVGAGEGIAVVLRAMAGDLELRDRVAAVLAVGGVIGGRPDEEGPFGAMACEDWLGRWFGHEALDNELVRPIPYLALQWLDPDDPIGGAWGLPLAAARFPRPSDEDGSALRVVEPVDLGPLPARDDLPLDLVARALWLLVTCRVRAWR